MFARVVVVQLQPEGVDQATAIYNDSIVPAAQQQPGFVGAYLLTHSGTGKGMSVTLWETEADMLAGQNSGYLQEQIAKLGVFMTAPPATENYEVSVQA